jgi:hypothetical protein
VLTDRVGERGPFVVQLRNLLDQIRKPSFSARTRPYFAAWDLPETSR